MIEVGANELLLHVTEFSVILGMFVMLFGLLVPRATESTSTTLAEVVARGGTLAHLKPKEVRVPAVAQDAFLSPRPKDGRDPTDAQDALVSRKPKEGREATVAMQPETVPASTFAAIMAEAKRQVDRQEHAGAAETTAIGPVDKTLLAQRITWPSLVDPDIESSCDLPTRLRLIEALSFIGGSWSIDILARAYEQELDANVRGAIFVALRDARSVA